MRFPGRSSGGSPPVLPEAEALPDSAEGVERAEPEEVATAVVVIAAVNLLPRTYAERAARSKAQFFAICAIAFALLLSVLLYLMAWQNAVSAQEKLDNATSQRMALQIQANRYAGVPRVFQAVDDAQAQLQIAMGNEVRWSFFMNDLALIMPSGVSLEAMQATSLAPGAAPAVPEGAAAAATVAAPVVPTVGTWQASGKAFSYNDVAKWLDTLARAGTLSGPSIGGMTQTEESDTTVVPFTSTASLTTEALSGRYEAAEAGQ